MESKPEYSIAPFTSEESVALSKFKDLLKSKKIDYDSTKFDDFYLVRFLRARKLDQAKSLEMFTNFLKWRAESKIDDMQNWTFPEIDQVRLYYPHGLHKTDKNGRPIYIEILGELRVDELFKVTTPERLLAYQAKCYERVLSEVFPSCSRAAKTHIHQTLTILDLKKLTAKLLSKKTYGFLKMTSFNSQNYYPEILGSLYIVNTGLLFKAAWSVCKAFLDEKTKKKVITLGSDHKKELLKHIDIQNLPSFLGGECKCEPYGCIYSNAGPWNKGDEKPEINPELLKMKAEVEEKETGEAETLDLEENQEFDKLERDDEEDNLDELSKQLNENMNLAKGQKENIQFKMESFYQDGQTPINTQEVSLVRMI
jgi:hypothetical protein